MANNVPAFPAPYFGGKSSVAHLVWEALGNPSHYIEPFFGSGAVMLNRPGWQSTMTETANDADGHIANIWRALQADPNTVAKWCDWPVNHADLIARKAVLNARNGELLESLCRDDSFYDAKLAGYWIWAASCWIGSGLVCPNQRPNISNGGNGAHAKGKRPHISNGGMGVQEPYNTNIYDWFRRLSERLRYVRVVCGDWTRVCGGDWQDDIGVCGIFFDPPYGHEANRDEQLYSVDCLDVAGKVRAWCLERGTRKSYRIVLAGYHEEHKSLLSHGWRVKRWKAQGGYATCGDGKGKENRHREALFFSPHCLSSELFQ